MQVWRSRSRSNFLVSGAFPVFLLLLGPAPSPGAGRSTAWRFPQDQPFEDGLLDGLTQEGNHLVLIPGAVQGSFTSPLIDLGRTYDRVVPSWNVRTPEGTVLELEARLHRTGQAVSDWMRVATWSRTRRGARDSASGDAKLDQETLMIARGADAVQLRATLCSGPSSTGPRLLAVGVTAFTSAESPAATVVSHGGATLKIPVPYRSQRDAPAPIASRVCGPTSLAMALDYHGVDLPTETVARLARDPAGSIPYGNWCYLAATAAELGMETDVRSMRSLDEVVVELKQGHPVLMGIAFEPGELPGAPISRTSGHLILARGYDRDGNIYVNDPAGHGPHDGQIRYPRIPLARAWKRGIGIVIRGPHRGLADPRPGRSGVGRRVHRIRRTGRQGRPHGRGAGMPVGGVSGERHEDHLVERPQARHRGPTGTPRIVEDASMIVDPRPMVPGRSGSRQQPRNPAATPRVAAVVSADASGFHPQLDHDGELHST